MPRASGPTGRMLMIAAALVAVLDAAAVGPLALGLLPAAAAAAPTEDARVQEAQRVLVMLGLLTGRPDGQLSERTRTALSSFQRQSKLPVTGKLDDVTLDALRAKRDTQFSNNFGAPSQIAPRPPAAEPKPTAQPVDPVASAPLAAGPGGRTSEPPPALFNSGAPPAGYPPRPAPPASALSAPVGGGIRDWLWVLPIAGIPVFVLLLWWGSRAPGAPYEAPVDGRRREPVLGQGPAGDGAPRTPPLSARRDA